MQKLFSLVIAAVMVAAGLVAGSGTAAHAGYQSIPTYTRISAPDSVERCDNARIGVRVTADSQREPKGKVLLKVRRDRGDFLWTDVKQYDGDKIFFRTPDLCKRGGYTIVAKFERKPESRWQDSDNVAEFRVVRR